jgi:tetratricopeptide (TPR) repeat protein
MSIFQIFLLLVAGSIFFIFFRQLLSGNYPKRGIDYEAKRDDDKVGSITTPTRSFEKMSEPKSRLEELIEMADEAVEKGDMLEARKAIQSALIVDRSSREVLRRAGYLYYELGDYEEAMEYYEELLKKDKYDDMAHNALANTLHKLNRDEEAITHHKRAIELDNQYAPYFFNYANTLYDLGKKDEALELYKRAYTLDNNLKEAKDMVVKIGGDNE